MRVLILGGTSEASALARQLESDPRFEPELSLAGRTRAPVRPIANTRVGGFGGAEGLAAYLGNNAVDCLVDATHPFAARISANAAEAARLAGCRLLALRRPAWTPVAGDRWIDAGTFAEAAEALGDDPKRVFLAIGRLEIAAFEQSGPHHYLLRTIDPPEPEPRFESWTLIRERGPFDLTAERDLLRQHGIDVVVTKNAGSDATYAKVAAARELGLPVIMIARPAAPDIQAVESPEETYVVLTDHLGNRP